MLKEQPAVRGMSPSVKRKLLNFNQLNVYSINVMDGERGRGREKVVEGDEK